MPHLILVKKKVIFGQLIKISSLILSNFKIGVKNRVRVLIIITFCVESESPIKKGGSHVKSVPIWELFGLFRAIGGNRLNQSGTIKNVGFFLKGEMRPGKRSH